MELEISSVMDTDMQEPEQPAVYSAETHEDDRNYQLAERQLAHISLSPNYPPLSPLAPLPSPDAKGIYIYY